MTTAGDGRGRAAAIGSGAAWHGDRGGDRPAVPAPLRSAVRATAAVAALVVALVGFALHGSRGPTPVDTTLTAAARTLWPRAGAGAYAVDAFAAPVVAAVVVAVLALGCVVLRRRRLAVVAAVGPLSAAAGTTVVKPLVDRTIHGDNLAYPSGHTAFAAAVALLVGLVLTALLGVGRALAAAVLAGLTSVLGAVMALDQVVLDAHYPTDTLGGFCTGVLVVSVVALLTDALADRVERRRRGAYGARLSGRATR